MLGRCSLCRAAESCRLSKDSRLSLLNVGQVGNTWDLLKLELFALQLWVQEETKLGRVSLHPVPASGLPPWTEVLPAGACCTLCSPIAYILYHLISPVLKYFLLKLFWLSVPVGLKGTFPKEPEISGPKMPSDERLQNLTGLSSCEHHPSPERGDRQLCGQGP